MQPRTKLLDPVRSASVLRTQLIALLASLIALTVQAADVPSRTATAAVSSSGPIVFLQNEMKKLQIPGAQLAVVRHGELIALGAYGLANIEHNVPVTDHTGFAINSCTKGFTGVALMQLVEDGKLDLDAPVSSYIDQLPKDWRAITIRQLATHMSGLPDIWNQTGSLVDGDIEASWAKVQTLPMGFKPGERVRYNQTNYYLLQLIIEKLSGRTFEQFVMERQFNVVGMPNTARLGWADDSTLVIGKARSYSNIRYDKKTGNWVHVDRLYNTYFKFPAFMQTATGLESTAEEIARWLIAIRSAKLLTPASVKEMWTPGKLNDGSNGRWAIGFPVLERAAHRAIQLSGGARSAFFVYPDDDVMVVLLTNLNGSSPEQFIDELAAYYIGDPAMRRASGFGLREDLVPLHVELARRGFGADAAHAVVEEAARKSSKGAPSVDDLQTWGMHLWGTGQREEALVIFKLNTRVHPDSAAAYETLAAVYEVSGKQELSDQASKTAQSLKTAARNKGKKQN